MDDEKFFLLFKLMSFVSSADDGGGGVSNSEFEAAIKPYVEMAMDSDNNLERYINFLTLVSC